MHRIFKNIRLLLAACVLTACTPARTGVIGNTLTTNVKPPISITGLESLTVKAHGVLRPETATDNATAREMVTFNYAFYADKAPAADIPANRFAYAVIARISTPKAWRFQPPSKADEALSARNITVGGIAFFEQILRVPSENDWGSGVWRKNGKNVPRYWLAKRWTAHLNDEVRAVMEYREEWPTEINAFSRDLLIVSGNAGQALADFNKRADAAFTVEKREGDFNKGQTPPSEYAVPENAPVIRKLIGEVVTTGNDT
ncbi:MAG: hypothetical protein DELT_01494 [Desulfovibrio sp.]